ncbi:MAG TPA: chromosomal replication initiator protein DnaA [Clostridiales bacterium]|nr:chromosomal replication initiator protein DnaA [Clostridiales bacterium]
MKPQLSEIWDRTLELLRYELLKPSFDTWLLNTQPLALMDDTIVIGVPNEFARDWLERRYAEDIRRTLRRVLERDLRIKFVIPNSSGVAPAKVPPSEAEMLPATARPAPSHAGVLNAKYTFDSFVVGTQSRLAHAACLAVAEAPARSYNPLFIYGGVGLGKTHLMQAVAHYSLQLRPDQQALYVSSEKFTNEMINSIRDDRMPDFKNRYRSIDLLLIDDIQFLAGKERTQEEFFYTFEALHGASRQIVISSDRPPKEIPTLEERLRTRFEWGLIADIQPPDFETRVAILRKKAQYERLVLPDDVASFIASRVSTNIRELEGALTRIMAYAAFTGTTLDIAVTAEALRDLVDDVRPRVINIGGIQSVVAQYYGLKIEDLQAKRRTRSLTFPRHVAIYLCRELTDASLPRIGDEFGGRDHTTVIYAHEKIKGELERDSGLRRVIGELTERVQGA